MHGTAGAHSAGSDSVTLLALFLVGVSLRPQLLGIGPLLPLIQRDLSISHAVAGLLITIPVFCMALSPFLVAIVSERVALRTAVMLSIGGLGVAGLLRAVAPVVSEIVSASVLVGMGLGIGGALLPLVVKEHLSRRPAFATGVYSAGIQAGAALSGAVAVPVAYLLGSWRGTMIAFSVFIGLIAVSWVLLSPRDRAAASGARRVPRLPWRSRIVWTIVLLFGLRSVVFQGLNAWLPAMYVEHGWSAATAGALVAVEIGVGLPTTLLVSRWADTRGTRRAFLVGGSLGLAVATAGIWLLPVAGWLWALTLGTGMGVLFPITLTLPLDLSENRTEVAGASALVLGGGYLTSAASPSLLGALRDASDSFGPVIELTFMLSCASLIVSFFMVRPERGGHPRDRLAS